MNDIVTPLPNPPPASDWSWPAVLLISFVVLLTLIMAFAALRRNRRMTTPADVLKKDPGPPRGMPPPLYPPV